MTQSLKNIGLRNGLFLGILLIGFSTYIHFYNLKLLVNVWYGTASLVISICFGIYSVLRTKKELGGLITFKQGFSSYFYTIFIAALLSTIYLLLLYLLILTPETKETIKELMINLNLNLMNQGSTPQDTIDQAIPVYEKFNPFTAGQVIAAAAKYLLRDCLIGVLIAFTFKNNSSS